MEIRFKIRTFGSNSMLNHHSSQKFKLIRKDKLNRLINILTGMSNSHH
jgi:hypothetical protein